MNRTTGVETYSPAGQLQSNVYLTPPDQSAITVLGFDPDGAVLTTIGRLRPIVGSSSLSNLSLRAYGPTADDPLIAGVALRGDGAMNLLVRAIGPGLTPYSVADAMPDPRLSFVRDGITVAANDNWGGSLGATFASVGAFALPDGSKDAALTASVTGGAYTGVVTPSGPGQGTVLAEVYQMSGTSKPAPQLVNVSGRSTVTSGHSLIAGFTLAGDGPATVLIRAAGPALAPFGVSNPLSAPRLTLYRGTTALWENAQWSSDSRANSTATAVGAFAFLANSNDAAVVVTLAPGSYTAVVASGDGSSGVALVEVYAVP